jgi:threonine/homoserine/homoserine lactone efflux protein
MPDLSQLVLYSVAALVLAVTPGPGIFYVAARTLAGGRPEGVASSVGTGLGGMIHVLVGSLGVSASAGERGTLHGIEAHRCRLPRLDRVSHTPVLALAKRPAT